jgi:hypothetical protein
VVVVLKREVSGEAAAVVAAATKKVAITAETAVAAVTKRTIDIYLFFILNPSCCSGRDFF